LRRVILAVSATVAGLVLLLGFKTQSASSTAALPAAVTPSSGSSSTSTSTGSSGSSSSGSTGTGSGSSTGSSGSSSSSGSTSSSTGTKTATGDAVDTRYGPVQVKITVTNGKITSAEAIDYPQNSPRDQEINSWAVPQLQQETISANSAKIDMLSGATYTSDGYIQSLQSALDKLA
jgi:uncharacterized protein with FMN-binding domain